MSLIALKNSCHYRKNPAAALHPSALNASWNETLP